MRMCTHLTMIIIMKQNNFTNITHLRVIMMSIIFFSSLNSMTGGFISFHSSGVYANCVSRVYLKCFVNFIMAPAQAQAIECKMHDIETDSSRVRFKQIWMTKWNWLKSFWKSVKFFPKILCSFSDLSLDSPPFASRFSSFRYKFLLQYFIQYLLPA